MKRFLAFTFILIYTKIFSQTAGPGTKVDFEASAAGSYTAAGAISGWTLSSLTSTNCSSLNNWQPGSSEFSIVSTPLLFQPFFGNLPGSPLGGSKVAKLNNTTANGSQTKLAQTLSITSAYSIMKFAYAGVWENGGHTCCSQAFFKVQLRDCNGNLLNCPSYLLAGAGCNNVNTYSTTQSTTWSNWQVQYISLGEYAGSCITVEVISGDCTFNEHYGTAYFDAATYTLPPTVCCLGCGNPSSYIQNVYYCPNTNSISLVAIPGYSSYTWISPTINPLPASQSTVATPTITNPVSGSSYTLLIQTNNSGCPATIIYSLQSTTFSANIFTAASCASGASGSGTILPIVQAPTYNFAWINSANTTVSTSSVAANLPPGNYTAQVQINGNPGCGIVSTVVTIGAISNSVNSLLAPFCASGQQATITAPAGNSYQWYNGTTSVPASQGGTATSYTINNPVNYSAYHLSFQSPQNCKDSIDYTLLAVSVGSMSAVPLSPFCAGSNSVNMLVSFTPALTSSLVGFGINSTGTTSPFNYSLNQGSLTSYTIPNLIAGGTYTMQGTDHVCNYNTAFTLVPVSFNFSLAPNNLTVCSGQMFAVGCNFTASPAVNQYAYQWWPGTFILGGNTTLQNAIINPTVAPGGSLSLTYSVTVTPSVANCPLTKTLQVTVFNPVAPVITPVSQSLCPLAGSSYTLLVSPPGGTFYSVGNASPPIGSNNGVITPSLAYPGINTFTYVVGGGTCTASSAGNYSVYPNTLSISGNTLLCSGSTITLSAMAQSYTWSNGSNQNSIAVSPGVTTSFSLSGLSLLSPCINTAAITISVASLPTVSISGNTTLCSGETTILNAIGNGTFLWNGLWQGNNFTLVTMSNTICIVSITDTITMCQNTASIQLQVNACLGLEKPGIIEGEFTLYPNPARQYVNITSRPLGKINLFSTDGQLIKTIELEPGNTRIDISELSNGIYVLRLYKNSSTKNVILLKLMEN